MSKRATKNKRELALTFAALATAAMGNASPTVVVAANDDRRELILTNVSDTTGYFAFGSDTNLTVTVYAWSLAAGATRIFTDLISTQAVYAVCGQASKDVSYQEAT